MNVRDAFYDILRTHGITIVFGNPGSNELPLLRDFLADFRYILALQEGAAIGMADGFAQATGGPDVPMARTCITATGGARAARQGAPLYV